MAFRRIITTTTCAILFLALICQCQPPPPSIGLPGGLMLTLENENFIVEEYDEAYAKVYGNIDADGDLSVTYDLQQPGMDVDVKLSIYHKEADGKYKEIQIPGVAAQHSLCKFFDEEKIMMPHLLEHMHPKPEKCPWPQNTYNLTKWKPVVKHLPPLVPMGQYQIRMDFNKNGKSYWIHSWFGNLHK